MAKSTKSRYAILGILAVMPNSSGYDIKKMMEESTHHFWKETFSSIYPMLQELELEGLVSQEESSSSGGRQRNLYSLSDKGEEILHEWLTKPVEYEQHRNELLLKLFFGKLTPPTFNRKHVEDYQKALQTKLNLFTQIKEELVQEHSKSPHLPYWLLTLDYGLLQVESALKWSKNALAQLNQMEEGAAYASNK